MALFGSLGQWNWIWLFRSNFGTILAKTDLFGLSMIKISKFYENFLLFLVWLFRPLLMCLVIRSKFGPFWPKISKICWWTPTFYWPPRLYLPIGIQNWPCFCWRSSSHFWLGSKSQLRLRPVSRVSSSQMPRCICQLLILHWINCLNNCHLLQ